MNKITSINNIKNGVSTPRYRRSPLYIAECAILTVLLAVKLYFFYEYIGIGIYSAVLTAATLGFCAAVVLAVAALTKRSPTAFYKALYALLSILMFIDRVYFSYIHKMPSWSTLKMAHQVADISDMILSLVTIPQSLYVLDLPIWLIESCNFKRRISLLWPSGERHIKYFKRYIIGAISVLLCCVLILIGFTAFGGFEVGYLSNALLSFHTLDAIDLLFADSSREVDAEEYIQKPTAETEASAEVDPLYACANGKNLIMIQVEALQNFVIGLSHNGQELTPNLNALIADNSLYFDNYYYQIGGGNTVDAEFAVLNSLYAPENEAAYVKYEQNDFHGLPWLLKDNGYTGAHVFHGYKGDFWNRRAAYPAQGFDDFYAEEDFNVTDIVGLGMSDPEFFAQSLEKIKGYSEPFFTFMITLSSHYPYVIPEEYKAIELLPEYEGTLLGDYFQAINYFDRALGIFIDGLREAGLYDDTMLVIYGDHYAIPSGDPVSYTLISAAIGHGYYERDIFNVPFIAHIPGLGTAETVSTVGGHIDALPTMLYLLGIQNDKSVMFGQNLLTTESGIVYEQTHLARGSFIDENVILCYPTSGISINVAVLNRLTGEREPNTGYDEKIAAAQKRYADCDALLERNEAVR